VVASEVRKLADQSKKSAERANQIVGDIQRATNGMVMTAEDGSKTTHSAAQSARLASAAFEKVIHLADAVFQNAQQVLLNSKQQAVALSQIDIAMKNISNGAREMSSGTVQIRDGMVKLSGVAGELQQVL
jgi:methyl-accepting chemotaxis protein